jgi:hypothetical protein
MTPEPIWFAVRVCALAGCMLWHKRSPSPHLVTAAAGMGIMTFLMLPSLFLGIFGWDTFDHQASRWIDPEPDTAHYTGRTSGAMLLDRCELLEWIGMAFVALGLTRFARQLTPPSQVA